MGLLNNPHNGIMHTIGIQMFLWRKQKVGD